MKIKIKIVPDCGMASVYEVDSFAEAIELLINQEPEDDKEKTLVTPEDRLSNGFETHYTKPEPGFLKRLFG